MNTLLQDRTQLLQTLRENLQPTQRRIENLADAILVDISFYVRDWVFPKLQPYKQISLTIEATHKFSTRFFGPFWMIAKIGSIAYRLALLDTAQLQDMFQVSKLKRCFGDPSIQYLPFPAAFKDHKPFFLARKDPTLPHYQGLKGIGLNKGGTIWNFAMSERLNRKNETF